MEKKLEIILHKLIQAEESVRMLKSQALKTINPESNLLLEDTQKLEELKAELEQKEDLIRKGEEFANVGRWIYMFDTDQMEWSDETRRIFEYPKDYEGSLKDFYFECVDPDGFEHLAIQIENLRLKSEEQVMTHSVRTPSGNLKTLSCVSSPILNEKGEIIGVEGFLKDISDHITGNKGLDNFFNLSHDLHCIFHLDGRFVKVSPSWTKLLGYAENELVSHSFLEFLHPEDKEKSLQIYTDVERNKRTPTFENRYISKSGEVVYLSWNTQLDTETKLAYCTARNITETRLKEEKLLSDLSGKELLLREIHHRVKNNLQIISSLLSLQSDINEGHELLSRLYADSKNRIHSMAAIHEMFYQSEELDKIDFSKYIKQLLSDLSNTFNSDKKSISFSVNATAVFVNLDTAIPLGLLINEVITNSIKHGANAEGNVVISIDMTEKENGEFEIMIGDTGINTRENILNQDFESLGVLLINSLVDQVDGKIEQLNKTEGTVFKLTLENKLVSQG
ncbi:histidine kinase dimerization/phosphoacceptor domain -containing protein [Brumimicrobium oceani]|uniref:histidine kinase n=1 Tax=Brumimicrobium oceani TaxID=2100725 RepID=A0A2U2X361_9FLAO|nr:histidine kinase dimerization/phosphoacceptor domain -containing protein [Brumimicrobium oceani]PWH82221.1 hypothetical protein DIT68_14035 [Brumimicrobium oceani]